MILFIDHMIEMRLKLDKLVRKEITFHRLRQEVMKNNYIDDIEEISFPIFNH
jgi:hypothetical protein